MTRVAVMIGLALAAVVTVAVALNLRYKPLHVAAGGARTAYTDTWTGRKYLCFEGSSSPVCVRAVEIESDEIDAAR